ncbi:50S ribosomal protein L11 methyltransferase [Lagierella sp.]|uniref:50S ribosomal protein L11 methyltransferase n=1 Tax=Lagierella sp. TaxID=2849657 RepID=UPI00262A30B8|nr:50S ribosomal protein L11 methyltransferase [Lagierella sp.]
MKWIEITIISPYQYEDLIYSTLYDYNIFTFEVVDDRTVDEVENTKPYWVEIDNDLKIGQNKLYIKTLLEENTENQEGVKNLKNDLLKISKDIELIYRQNCEEYDWSIEWKKFFKPFEVGDKFVIVPSWEDYDNISNKLILNIDPGMAFGTGSHETTSICLSMLEKLDLQNKKVCDVGTGSGILAIASAKLGADSILAIDIDSQSVKTAKENVDINNCNDKIKVLSGDLLSSTSEKYDLIIANILPDVIIELIPQAVEKLKNNGYLLVSGIILEKKDMVMKELIKNDFQIVLDIDKGEWTGILGRKNV